MACFWDVLTPNDRYIFCEEQLCAMIVEPANTWSNIGYLIIAIMMLQSRTVTNRRVKHLFAGSTFALFIGSTLFHASGTYMGRIADVGAMFFLSTVILTLSAERFFSLRERWANAFFLLLLATSLYGLVAHQIGSKFFALQILLATIIEWRMAHTKTSLNGKKVLYSVLLIIAAFTFWILDVKKILCDPGNHILTDHGMWHLLAAGAIWVFFTSYAGMTQLTSQNKH